MYSTIGKIAISILAGIAIKAGLDKTIEVIREKKFRVKMKADAPPEP